MAYVLLLFSIISEVFGTTMLKLSTGFKRILPIIGVIIGYGVSFYLLSKALIELPLGFSYAVWSGVGTVATTIVGKYVTGGCRPSYKSRDPLNGVKQRAIQ